MRLTVFYDIADPIRLRRVERAVSAVGNRLHYSAFVCDLSDEELKRLQKSVAILIDVATDSVRYLPLCERDRKLTVHLGSSAWPEENACWIV